MGRLTALEEKKLQDEQADLAREIGELSALTRVMPRCTVLSARARHAGQRIIMHCDTMRYIYIVLCLLFRERLKNGSVCHLNCFES